MDKETTSTIVRNINKKTWLQFRSLCLKKSISANKQIIALIERYCKKGGKL